MPPKKISKAPPPPSRPQRVRKPSARAIEAAANKAAEARLKAVRKKGNRTKVGAVQAVQEALETETVTAQPGQAQQTQQAQPHPSTAPAQELPQALLPPPQAPVPTNGAHVYKTYREAVAYEPDSYKSLNYYFHLEQSMRTRTEPMIEPDFLKPPTVGLIFPPCHDHDPPTPMWPDPDDIEPIRRRIDDGGGYGNGGGSGGGYAAGFASADWHAALQPPPATRQQWRRSYRSAPGKRPRTLRPSLQLKQARASQISPVQHPPISSGQPWWIEHTLFVFQRFVRFVKKEHAKKWYEHIWWRHQRQQHEQQQSTSSKTMPPLSWPSSEGPHLIDNDSPCQACIDMYVPDFIP